MGETDLRLTRLALTDFRNYPHLVWQPGARLVCITGPNGAGKTNLLEAISLLVPGRGLRGARAPDLGRHDPSGTPWPWAINGRFTTPTGELEIATGTLTGAGQPPAERRVFRLDGQPARSQAAIGARLAAVWLTPQMDRLFVEGAAARRRFLDRLVFALEPGHAREAGAHDHAVTSRNRLLARATTTPAWLAGVEDSIARHAVALTAARLGLVRALTAALADGAAAGFPVARLRLLCPIADRLATAPALAVEDWLRASLAASRATDTATGSTALGAHRTDLALSDESGLDAALASTGQQKALLVGTILGHAALIQQARGFAPLLLLDEPAVHLDEDRRRKLFTALAKLTAQAFITGTDADVFKPLEGQAKGFELGQGSALDPLGGGPPRPA